MNNHSIRTSQMVNDAYWMGLNQFIDTWGISQARVWSDVRRAAEERYQKNRQKTAV